MLALMALIGITFATFSGQSRVSARNFAQSMNQPQRDELMDYALSQLIGDTPDIRSAIRGHSLARDMYGNDAYTNGYLPSRPDGEYRAPNGDPYFYISGVTAGTGTQYLLTTNILAADPTFYGYNFNRWNLRVSYQAVGAAGIVDQTFEILLDSGFNANNNGYRTFTVNIGYTEGNSIAASTGPPPTPATPATTLVNPTQGTTTTLPGQSIIAATGSPRFVLDGRWLHAFNGPGMAANAVHANFRYNGLNPNAAGMDEDYDAVDLENWFLAMQSADGSVMIPSFHRPAAIRNDSTVTPAIYDWGGPQNAAFENAAAGNWSDSASRILRPRAADGHDASAFPDLVPDSTGKITYDVDNDGDGITDSVWLDLGYPARRNAQGQIYKPLFAFMVIGLNGRIPLNTAGNLAGNASGITTSGPTPYTYGGGLAHAAHLGNSVSEVDPTYALQNAFDVSYANDANYAFSLPGAGAANTQVDNAGIDVRLTQLRNLLAGTRPPQKDSFGTGTDGDTNYVFVESAKGIGPGNQVLMPNGVADPNDSSPGNDAKGHPYVLRLTPPVAGRWGEPGSIPGGVNDPNSGTPPAIAIGGLNYLNLVQVNYNNPVRAGYSYDIADVTNGKYDKANGITSGFARDAADDNYNAFDPFPLGHNGELNDSDAYDLAGALILPVDRMRRYVTPADINGTGSVVNFTNSKASGADSLGRVLHYSYFRPPGTPGSIATSPTTPPGGPIPTTVGTIGAIYYPYPFGATGTNYFYTQGPNNNPYNLLPTATLEPYLPDVTNNPLHAFEFFKLPPIISPAPTGHTIPTGFKFQFQRNRNPAMPLDGTTDTATSNTGFPISFPTYDYQVNSMEYTDGLNDADEMNLYVPNPQADAPFGASDLEWLYRQQDVDGSSLISRLQYLAPVSFTNTIDGQRRRRLFSLDSWELNNFVWTNDNPGNVFPNNSNFTATQNASFLQLSANLGLVPVVNGIPTPTPTQPGLPTPSLAHRDKKINLNYPLPVSNDPNEPIRQKWVSDAYQLMKSVLPPQAVDTADELAALSQFLVNVIDFRDPDCTMTHFRNPDVKVVLGSIGAAPNVYNPSYLAPIRAAIQATSTAIPLDQYGMEYNPIAINEAIAYSFLSAASTQTNRFYVELVNTLSQSAIGLLPANDFGAGIVNPPDPSILDLSLANYDLVMTADDPVSRPDPFTGQLLPIQSANYYGQIPFNQTSSTTSPLFSSGAGQVQLNPLTPVGAPAIVPAGGDFTLPNYFYSIMNPNPGSAEPNGLMALATLSSTYDPLAPASPPPPPPTPPPTPTPSPTNVVAPGYSPNLASIIISPTTQQPVAGPVVPGKNNTVPPTVPQIASNGMLYYWICLRRPANPFAAPQPDVTQPNYNPMVVVDALRFPYIEGGGTYSATSGTVTQGTNVLFSSQRCQPYRGGHAVRLPGDTGTSFAPLNTAYGYSEQMAAPITPRNSDTGMFTGVTPAQPITQPIYHTIGGQNDQPEPWDYFPFNDRDFTSVAELTLVPGCPPGLFTKQFVELAPMPPATAPTVITGTPLTQFPVSIPPANPTANPPTPLSPSNAVPSLSTSNATNAFTPGGTGTAPTGVAQPHTYPYLVDKFFYSGYGAAASSANPPTTPPPDPGNVVDGYGADGWFRMFEFFEVPSQSFGSIGPVAQGTDFDWARQDLKPGLLNLNLIIDEEVFFSILGSQKVSLNSTGTDAFTQQLLNFAQLPSASTADIPVVVTQSLANYALSGWTPVWGFGGSQPGMVGKDPITQQINNGMKAAFAQFLILRHGANWDSTKGHWLLFSGNAERPFHSLSYPDINYTVMRPANLPPASPSMPSPATAAYPPAAAPFYIQDPGVRNPYINPPSPPSGIVNAMGVYVANTPPVVTPPTASQYGAYFNTASGPMTSYVSMPSPIPVRRLFQIPDAYTDGAATTYQPTPPTYPPTTTTSVSNAGDSGDPFINPFINGVNVTAGMAAGALGPVAVNVAGVTTTYYFNNGYPNLFWSGGSAPAGYTPTSVYLGANNSSNVDNRQHPYWRSEMMQKVMNLTTVRTHQYAVWITIGFFEVKREGDLGNILQSVPLLAYDLLGPEIGAASGQTTRYRGFFLVDRTKLYSFDDTTPGSFTPAVVYRQTIE